MRRYLAADAVIGAKVAITGPEFHHLARVAHHRVGEEVVLLDGRGGAFRAVIRALSESVATLEVVGGAPSPASAGDARLRRVVTLACAVVRDPRMVFLVEKAAELGVSALQPLLFARGLVRPREGGEKAARWRRVAEQSCKQSGRVSVMTVSAPCTLDEHLARGPRDEATARPLRLLCSPGGGEPLGKRLDALPAGAAVEVLIGPEGGLTPEEENRCLAAGYARTELGPHLLRTETAALAAAARALIA